MNKDKWNQNDASVPSIEQMEQEWERVKAKRKTRNLMFGIMVMILAISVASIIISNRWLSALQVYGNSMSPTLQNGQILIAWKQESYQSGDIVVISHQNKVLLKRVIASEGQQVAIEEDGTVVVSGKRLEEPYIQEKHKGVSDWDSDYLVGKGAYFVLGDNRAASIDSRLEEIGEIRNEQIIGKVVFRIWPFDKFNQIK